MSGKSMLTPDYDRSRLMIETPVAYGDLPVGKLTPLGVAVCWAAGAILAGLLAWACYAVGAAQ